jgi:hypothetical protein
VLAFTQFKKKTNRNTNVEKKTKEKRIGPILVSGSNIANQASPSEQHEDELSAEVNSSKMW